jgi:hypothetical protein
MIRQIALWSLPVLLLSACSEESAPVLAPEGACGGIAQVKGWEVTYASDFVGSDEAGAKSVSFHEHLAGLKVTTDTIEDFFMPGELAWRLAYETSGTGRLGDTARASGSLADRLGANGATVANVDVAVYFADCAIQLFVSTQLPTTGVWDGTPFTGSEHSGSFTTGRLPLPVSEFRFEGVNSGGTITVPAIRVSESNFFPDTLTYLVGGLAPLFPYDHVFGTATAKWSLKPIW